MQFSTLKDIGDYFGKHYSKISRIVKANELYGIERPDPVFFSWIHFEASSAFFDQKLLPVSVDGVEVPLPYCRVQHENVSTNTEEECYDEALDRVANEAQRRLHGDAIDAVFTRVYRRLNSLFFTGLQILFALVSAFVLIGIVPGTAYAHVNHLHV